MIRAGVLSIVVLGLGAWRQLSAANPYTVSLNTAMLQGHPASPFSIAFQLTDGSATGDSNNTITISAFNFGGGNASGSPNTLGGVTGSLNTKVALTDSLFLNYFIQPFTPGTQLSFQVSATNNIDATS